MVLAVLVLLVVHYPTPDNQCYRGGTTLLLVTCVSWVQPQSVIPLVLALVVILLLVQRLSGTAGGDLVRHCDS